MNETYLKRLKSKLKKAIESGMLNPEQQIAVIDDVLEKLCMDEDYAKKVKGFDGVTEELEKTIRETQEKLFSHYNKIYESILSDL